jgi:hypothetical protein
MFGLFEARLCNFDFVFKLLVAFPLCLGGGDVEAIAEEYKEGGLLFFCIFALGFDFGGSFFGGGFD